MFPLVEILFLSVIVEVVPTLFSFLFSFPPIRPPDCPEKTIWLSLRVLHPQKYLRQHLNKSSIVRHHARAVDNKGDKVYGRFQVLAFVNQATSLGRSAGGLHII